MRLDAKSFSAQINKEDLTIHNKAIEEKEKEYLHY